MAVYDDDIEMALEMIAESGQLVTWRQINDASPVDPTEPWKPGKTTPTDFDATICFFPVDKDTAKSFSTVKGSEIPKGCTLGYMGQAPFVPNLKDVVIRNGKQLRIVDFDVIAPNGEIILYTVIFQQ